MKHQASPQVGISGIYAGEDVKMRQASGIRNTRWAALEAFTAGSLGIDDRSGRGDVNSGPGGGCGSRCLLRYCLLQSGWRRGWRSGWRRWCALGAWLLGGGDGRGLYGCR